MVISRIEQEHILDIERKELLVKELTLTKIIEILL